MKYREFEAAAIALLAAQPPGTMLVCAGDGLFLTDGELCSVPKLADGTYEPMTGGCNVDGSAWNDDTESFDSMTAADIDALLAAPVFLKSDGGPAT